ncbi:hypothetical protein [Bradyrhizobium sp. WSM3983]|uniref:hypothetical protein n=1 Tax=Bradyrhizobium sp. WSM3983 TaxID=1038867 RepID=UPI0004814A04|nr:hypothetical protein [Bradyrhizobium sp. WSM3983]
MPSGDDDAIVARCEPLPVFGELLLGARLLVEIFAGKRFFGELLTDEFLVAGRAFLECRTLIRFWSYTGVKRRAGSIAIRLCAVMHMGFAVQTHVSRSHISVPNRPCDVDQGTAR